MSESSLPAPTKTVKAVVKKSPPLINMEHTDIKVAPLAPPKGTKLGVYRVQPEFEIPGFSTSQAACFDLAMQVLPGQIIKGFNAQNKPIERKLSPDGTIAINGGDRLLIPTGLIFDIPENFSVRIHSRSGLSLKSGIVLANHEAVIDSDFTHETMVMLTNVGVNTFLISKGDRIAQAELVPSLNYSITDVFEAPKQKGNRTGGLGSTGVSRAV